MHCLFKQQQLTKEIREDLKELKKELDGVDEGEAGERIRSWIEQ